MVCVCRKWQCVGQDSRAYLQMKISASKGISVFSLALRERHEALVHGEIDHLEPLPVHQIRPTPASLEPVLLDPEDTQTTKAEGTYRLSLRSRRNASRLRRIVQEPCEGPGFRTGYPPSRRRGADPRRSSRDESPPPSLRGRRGNSRTRRGGA